MTSEAAMSLSAGVVSSHLKRGLLPPEDRSVLRVLGTKEIDKEKVRLAVTDGKDRFTSALLVVGEGVFLPEKDDVVDFRYFLCSYLSVLVDPSHHLFPSSCFRCGPVRDSNRMIEKEGRHIWVINQFKVLKSAGFTPDLLPSTPSSSNGAKASSLSNAPPETPSKKRPAQNDDGTSNGGTPLSSSNSFGASSSVSSAKRSLFDGAMAQPVRSSSTPSTSSAPQFIPERATHKISDLNPYQNKYTIRARCVHRGELAERSTSRWQGHVFSVVLQDKSGDIRATGFSEFAKKFHPMFKEGAVYYVSHAQVRLN